MEEWRDIQGYEGLYQVSNNGRVRSVDRTLKLSNGKVNRYRGVILLQSKSCGYMAVSLRSRKVRVHRLVASAFIPNPDGKTCVNHKDGDKTNNHVDNLEWCTYSENEYHAYQTGLKVKSENAGRKRRLSEKQVIEIRNSVDSKANLARRFGVSEATIYGIQKGIIYKEE